MLNGYQDCPRNGSRMYFRLFSRQCTMVRKCQLLCLLLGVGILPVQSQNLVPNHSFETANCPTGYNGTPGQVALYIPSWYSANCASPDPMTDCSNHAQTSVPDVWFGHSYARTGNNFMGIGFYGAWYEYIGTQLTQPLAPGATYYVSFYVRCAQQAKYASDAFGIHLSNTQVICTSGFSGPVLPLTPHIIPPPGVFLSDTSGWVEVSGLYTAAGGEEYLVLGCFNNWNVNELLDIGGSAARCYYFVDDITVQDVATMVPGQPGMISGETVLCEGSVHTYTISPVPEATSYIWTLPPGWSGTSSSNSITVTAGASGGNISVTAVNSFGNSSPQVLPVTVTPLPGSPVAVYGQNLLCPGEQAIYTTDPVSGADGYTWLLPSGWTGNSNDTSVVVTAGNAGGTISVSAYNSCGTSALFDWPVSVVYINDIVTLSSGTLLVEDQGADYQWVDCANNYQPVISGDQYTFVPLQSGTYAAVITKDGCTDTSVCIAVSVDPLSAATEQPEIWVSVFPNPASQLIHILPAGFSSAGFLVELADVTGKMVASRNVICQSGTITFSLDDVPAGIYVLKVSDGIRWLDQKISIIK